MKALINERARSDKFVKLHESMKGLDRIVDRIEVGTGALIEDWATKVKTWKTAGIPAAEFQTMALEECVSRLDGRTRPT